MFAQLPGKKPANTSKKSRAWLSGTSPKPQRRLHFFSTSFETCVIQQLLFPLPVCLRETDRQRCEHYCKVAQLHRSTAKQGLRDPIKTPSRTAEDQSISGAYAVNNLTVSLSTVQLVLQGACSRAFFHTLFPLYVPRVLRTRAHFCTEIYSGAMSYG